MSGIRAWWEEDRNNMSDFYNRVLCFGGDTPYFCEPYVCERILEHHLASPSILVILPLQDWLSLSEELRSDDIEHERINVPAVAHHYWRYRMHLSLGELIGATNLNEKIQDLIVEGNR
jgi:4-alpha-glucanotransferase